MHLLSVFTRLIFVPYIGANSRSQPLSNSRDAFGFTLGTHFSTFDVKGFGVDGAVQVSIHSLPVSINESSGALSRIPGDPISEVRTPMPGFAATVLPRFTGAFGTFFAGLQVQSNADIEARGVRVTTGNQVADDYGSLVVLGQVGTGYAVTFGPGVGLTAQVWLPLGGEQFGYGPSLNVGLHIAIGKSPPQRRSSVQSPSPVQGPSEPPLEPVPSL